MKQLVKQGGLKQVCRDCQAEQVSCERCETDGVCVCCSCECDAVDPSPMALESMRLYDARTERGED